MNWIDHVLIPLIKVIVIFVVMLLSVPMMIVFERKIIGRILCARDP
jgi:NADH:ubiquinone oxidoreductase subunit H